jgi:glucoamylase
MSDGVHYAPGWPGIPARWTSSAKSGVGTALSSASRVWFTLSHGILNEIYYPRVDRACTRDLGLIVTDRRAFFSEEKRHTDHRVEYLAEGIPAYRLINTCAQGRYRIEKEVLTDPARDVVLQRIRFVPLKGTLADYRLYALLAPHLANQGAGNTAWVGDHKGVPMLFAERDGTAVALACSVAWRARSAGYLGISDGWQDLWQHRQLTWTFARAEHGNVALVGEVHLQAAAEFVLALGFGATEAEAGHRVTASLLDGFDVAEAAYITAWDAWQQTLSPAEATTAPAPGKPNIYRVSTAVLRTHEAKYFPGGIIASLSVPWGFARGDGDLGGYHLIWPRDLVEAAGGLLAAGATDDALRVLHYLRVTQEPDGHWPQNMWLDGTAYGGGVQMDETALPILLADLMRRVGGLDDAIVGCLWPMVRRAAGYVVRNGPVTQEDRWEEDPGYTPFTLAAEIAALLAAADLAELSGEAAVASYLRETADVWNDGIERWTYAANTDLARRFGVRGYYVRITPADISDGRSPLQGFVPIKNRPGGTNSLPIVHVVSPDALAYVRFGLRAPHDPRILDTVRVVDALLKVETPVGPAWRRYSDDGYGEHGDGAPFDGTGIGRVWPLLTGERAHYELAAGRWDSAKRLAQVFEAFASNTGLISEQVWDTGNIPERELFFGRPSGSAMPLVWAHAEYIKLRRSLQDGGVFDMPPQPLRRYQKERTESPYAIWRFNHKCRTVPTDRTLRVEVLAPAIVHWSADGWKTIRDARTRDTGLGVYVAEIPTETLGAGAEVDFTLYWPGDARWEGVNFRVVVQGSVGHEARRPTERVNDRHVPIGDVRHLSEAPAAEEKDPAGAGSARIDAES